MADFSYTPYEAQTIQDHIIKHYGNISRTITVKECERLDLKLYVIEPTKEREFYTVITSGMGAYKMDLPDDFKDDNVDRIELLIYLSSNWNIDGAFKQSSGSTTGLIIDGSVTPLLGNINAQWNYPIQILKNLAQAPVNNESYFVMGNIMDDETPFSESTHDSGGILMFPAYTTEEGQICTLPDGQKVGFLQIMPITSDEIERAANLNRNLIFHKLIFHNFIIYQDRYLYDYENIFDDGMLHLLPLYKENIVQQSGELNAFNHMAILLRWLIEHDMMSDEFISKYSDEINTVKTSPESIDLRNFIIDKLIGTLRYEILNDDIIDFIESYCLNNPDEGIVGQYYDDIAAYALDYFENNNIDTDDMCDMEYCFMELTEKYYQDIAKIIDENYKEWQEGE